LSQVDANGCPPSIAEFGDGLRIGEFTAVEMTRYVLELAGSSQKSINAFIAITAELALSQAAAVDAELAEGRDAGPLMGVPFGVKDVFDVMGVPTTAGSRIFADNVAGSTAVAVSRLVRAGAVIVGKTNMDQFAFGPHQADFGRTNCPADTTRYAGGSSGGSAAAVASGSVIGALGSDAGGSTRFPAACCGVVGFKPTFGRVPTSGVFPTFPTLDHVGEIARSVPDVQAIFATVADQPRQLWPRSTPLSSALPQQARPCPSTSRSWGWATHCRYCSRPSARKRGSLSSRTSTARATRYRLPS
jgi:aspartyl-tRNA(Asn)/glutamyl-tRNA(Gln) amidotransferase subunit A